MSEGENENREKDTSLGIDFGGTSVKVAAVRGGKLLGEVERIVTSDCDSADAMVTELAVSSRCSFSHCILEGSRAGV